MEKHIKTPITKEIAEILNAGDYIYLTGTIYTARAVITPPSPPGPIPD